jgi:redox-sensitive bicupin YhaK (pirin superfamily)
MQMWITPAVSGLEPSYEQLRFTKEQRTGKLLAIASGQNLAGAVKVHQDTTLYASFVRPEDEIAHALGQGRRAYLFVIDGDLQVNGRQLESGDQAKITDEQGLRITATKPSELILIDLP